MITQFEISFTKDGKQLWNEFVENNTDPSGMCIVNYAKYWAYLMEQQIASGLTPEIKESTKYKADIEGITGFMFGVAVDILSQCWIHGETLRKIHNGEYNYEGNGIINPATLTLSIQD